MQFLRNQWFLLILMLALGGGYWFAEYLRVLTESSWLKWSVVGGTMFLMTWPMELTRLMDAGTRPLAPATATILNLLVAPLLAWPLSRLLGDELGPGLILALAVPSTLVSASVWTRRAGGNDSVSLMVTLITNLLCFVVTPAWVYGLIGIEIPINVLYSTIQNLFLFVVVPMTIGQLFRIHQSSAVWATQNKPRLAVGAQIGVLVITLLGAVNMKLRILENANQQIAMNLVLASLVIVLALHLFIFILGVQLGKGLGCSVEDQIAIGFSSSQKTLMVGLSTALSMGLNIIPIVAYHALQLIVDTLIADRYRNRPEYPNDSENQNASDSTGKL